MAHRPSGQIVPYSLVFGVELAFYLVPGAGFEPTKAKPADLQSAPFGHSGIPADGSLARAAEY